MYAKIVLGVEFLRSIISRLSRTQPSESRELVVSRTHIK